jgi:pimeloyl-ACP methyl ester carboxylesterase
MKCVSLGDTEIEYSESGAGEPLLLVHAGVFANWFAPMAESHALDGFRVIRVRRAGYGRNAPKRPLTLQDHANHLAALAAHLGLEAVHLVGHSSSALIGLDAYSLNSYTIITSSILYFQRNTTGAALISSKY